MLKVQSFISVCLKKLQESTVKCRAGYAGGSRRCQVGLTSSKKKKSGASLKFYRRKNIYGEGQRNTSGDLAIDNKCLVALVPMMMLPFLFTITYAILHEAHSRLFHWPLHKIYYPAFLSSSLCQLLFHTFILADYTETFDLFKN
jgi:hypothetical protein